MYSALRTLFICLILASTTSQVRAFEFEGPFPSGNYPFTVKGSGVEVQIDTDTKLEWLDDERVIFTALSPGQPRLQGKPTPGQMPYAGRVMVWNTRTGEVKEYSPGRLWCSYKGYVSIFYTAGVSADGKYIIRVRSGQFGHEQDKPAWKTGDPKLHADVHTCAINDGPTFNPDPSHVLLHLREQDGVLDFGPKGKSYSATQPVSVIRPDGTRIELPIKAREAQGVWWNDWAGVYLLAQLRYGGFISPREPDTLPILYPDGRLERYPLPASYWQRNETSRVVLTKRGLFVANDGVGIPAGNKGESGAYLIRGNSVARLVDWYVGNEHVDSRGTHRGIAVSPNGCKVAFKHGEGLRYTTSHTIKMINVCEGE
ncbi:MAG: hypothetical protein IV108_04975 [Burkholderiales bacterium]|nr:hypothetical protein [Burkholderiales bacterium]